jgi:hypothetical protein
MVGADSCEEILGEVGAGSSDALRIIEQLNSRAGHLRAERIGRTKELA